MTRVVSREGESPESLLRRFRNKVTKDGILSDLKKSASTSPRAKSGVWHVARRFVANASASGVPRVDRNNDRRLDF